MGFKEFLKRHKIAAGITALAVLYGANSYVNRFCSPVIEGRVVNEVVIPKDISKSAQETFPYWIDVNTKEYGILRVNFDTSSPTIRIAIGYTSNFDGQATVLEGKIQPGDRVKVRVFQFSKLERQAVSLEGVYREDI